MRLSPKDAIGIGLVTFTGLLAMLHAAVRDREGSKPREVSVADPSPALTEPDPSPPTAFFDFNVLPADYSRVSAHQVVIVRGAVVERIGAVGAVTIPMDAHRIEGNGSAFLLPAPRSPLDAIEVGRHADLVLLKVDPRKSLDALRHPAGLMIRGQWREPSEAVDQLVEAGEDP